MAGFTTFPPNIPSRPPPPPPQKGDKREPSLSQTRSPLALKTRSLPLEEMISSPLLNNLIIIAHHTQVPAP